MTMANMKMTNTMMTNMKMATTLQQQQQQDSHHLCSRLSLPVRRCEREAIVGARVQGKNLPGTTHYHICLISFRNSILLVFFTTIFITIINGGILTLTDSRMVTTMTSMMNMNDIHLGGVGLYEVSIFAEL